MESPHIKYELSFEEYQNLIEQFSNLVKTKDFKPLDYKDYRRIAGKHLNGIVSKVIIEFVDESHFIITFYPTKETIYAGNIFDLSFGTFINYFNFEEEPKETMEKNNTYDIWGNGISNIANNTSNTTDSISYQTTTSCHLCFCGTAWGSCRSGRAYIARRMRGWGSRVRLRCL